MEDVDLKKLGTLRLCGGGALVALATLGVWAFCSGGFSASSGWESAFDGWRYGREDQKAASAALAAAGLDEWSWDDGRLLVPKNKKSEYQTALAEAGAYPKAPSESRRDAIREMGAFESEAKIRMRELDVCASQLERTLERIGGIEYATVGVRARREQAGLTAKTIVTASIGVACREGAELDAELLSAITVAAKHQLGVDANENISILDLKAGKSYFGSEKLVGNGIELMLAAEKERVEIYWRNKMLKAFDYMGGVRVSVAAELVVADPNDVLQTEVKEVFDDLDYLNDSNNLNDWNGLNALQDRSATAKIAKSERATSAARRLAQTEIGAAGEIGKPRPLATWSGGAQKSAGNGGAFARLGNPIATRNATPVKAANLAQVERRTLENGVLSVGAIERLDAPKRGVVSAGYRQDAGNEEDEQVERVARAAKEEAIKGNETETRLDEVAQVGKAEVKNGNKKNKGNGESKVDENEARCRVSDGERVRFRVKTLAVRIGTPRGYVRRVAQNLRAEKAVETFATDETAGSWDALYRTTEQKIIEETKNVALLLLRPFAEQNDWTENELARAVAVDVFADLNDFAERDDENNPNGPIEVVANFGRADVSELVAEETTFDAPKTDEEKETTSKGAKEEAATDFWAVWEARARRLDAKTKAGVGLGVGVLTILTLATRRRKKRSANLEEAEIENKSNDARRTVAQNKEKKKDRRVEKDELNKKSSKTTENGGVFDGAKKETTRQERGTKALERSLRIARIGEKTSFAQDAETKEVGEETRGEASSQNFQTAKIRRFVSAAQGEVGVVGRNERKKSEKFEEIGEFSEFDDWDELDDDLLEIRSLIEKERARVADETAETVESMGGATAKNVGEATRRREALDLVARNPERAAASLQRWLRPGA